ncbi:MAG: hypothetical protein WAN87_07100 [Thermoplasmata archaeon]
MADLLSEVDRLAFTDELVDYFRAAVREGQRAGVAGLRDDNLAWVKPWGFEFSTIGVPVQVWHGKQAKIVPLSMGEWMAAHLSHADVHLEPGEGHVTLFEHKIPSVHEWLASHF